MSTNSPTVSDDAGYRLLRSIAQRLMNRESCHCTLTATGLVHELYLRLAKTSAGQVGSAKSTVPFASRLMRQILIDRARKRQTRRSAENKHLDSELNLSVKYENQEIATERAIQLEDALELLGEEMPETAELVRLKVYLDLPIDSAAAQLGLSRATAYRKWTFAKAWLTKQLQWPHDL